RNPDMKYDVSDSYILRKMCDFNLITLTTIHRYDNELADKNHEILQTGKLTGVRTTNEVIDNNICFTHRTRIDVNRRLMNLRKPENAKLLKYEGGVKSDTQPQDVW